jgi:hypothetical protein
MSAALFNGRKESVMRVFVVVAGLLMVMTYCLGTESDTADSYVSGLQAGRLAAYGKGADALWSTLAGGVACGCCLGGIVPFPVSAPYVGMAYPCVFGGLGGAATGVLVTNQGTPIPAVLLQGKSEDYRLGFIEGYSQRVGEQRRSKALIGTAIGAGLATAIGIVILVVAAGN